MRQTVISRPRRKGVIRGLHLPHERGQDDLFACLRGTVGWSCSPRDAARRFTEDIGDDNPVAIYVPVTTRRRRGAHRSPLLYHVTEEYDADRARTSTASAGPIRASSTSGAPDAPILSARATWKRAAVTGAGGELGRALVDDVQDDGARGTRAEWDVTLPPPAGLDRGRLSFTPPRGPTSTARRTIPQGAAAVNVGGTANVAALGAPRSSTTRPTMSSTVASGSRARRVGRSNPQSAYGRTKLHGEAAAGEARRGSCARPGSSARPATISSGRCCGSRRSATRCRSWTTNAVRRPMSAISRRPRGRPSELPYGVYHVAAEGEATWADFAEAIFAEAGLESAGAAHRDRRLDPPRKAPRPAYSGPAQSRRARRSPAALARRPAGCIARPAASTRVDRDGTLLVPHHVVLDAPQDDVWHAIHELERWPEWWRGVLSVEKLEEGDANGIGASPPAGVAQHDSLPGRFESTITRIEKPHLIEAARGGELTRNGALASVRRPRDGSSSTSGTCARRPLSDERRQRRSPDRSSAGTTTSSCARAAKDWPICWLARLPSGQSPCSAMRVLVTGGAGFIGSPGFAKRLLAAATTCACSTSSPTRQPGQPRGHRHRAPSPLTSATRRRWRRLRRPRRDRQLRPQTHVDRSILGATDFGRTEFRHAGAARGGAPDRAVRPGLDRRGVRRPGRRRLPRSRPTRSSRPAPTASRRRRATCTSPPTRARSASTPRSPAARHVRADQYPEKLIPLDDHDAIEGQPLPVYATESRSATGSGSRITAPGSSSSCGRREPGKVYNVGGDDERENVEIVGHILRLTGADESLIRHVEDRAGHDRRYSLDTAAARRLGWEPRKQVEEGIARRFPWYLAEPRLVGADQVGEYRELLEKQYASRLASSRRRRPHRRPRGRPASPRGATGRSPSACPGPPRSGQAARRRRRSGRAPAG